MIVDLTNMSLFKNDTLALDKDINFIFGKNGTGKSTITNLIKNSRNTDFEIRIFQGFESVLGENEKLNAVVLGEENKLVNQKIQEKELEILEIRYEIAQKNTTINKPENEDEENLFTKHKKAMQAKDKKEKEIEKFYTDAASKISRNNILIDNARYYNKNNFKNEIAKGKSLERTEIINLELILKSGHKIAKNITFPKVPLNKYLESVNEILNSKVQAKIIIEELQNNPQKLDFAQEGLNIHKAGDKCAFCGNEVGKERFHSLKKYFSADAVIDLKNRIEKGKQIIIQEITEISALKISLDEFYPDFLESATILERELSDLKLLQLEFLGNLKKHLENKEKNLFEEQENLDLKIPIDFNEISEKYTDLMTQNNIFADNLLKNQERAKNELRYHEVKKLVDNFQLDVKKSELASLNNQLESIIGEIDTVLNEIKNKDNRIISINKDISELLKQTKNTKKLAENINNKLKGTVTFELIRKEDKDREFYEIKGINGEIRSIKELSTGEKNIISFLYFIEKLNEINATSTRNKKLIVFDDPMNSNDDTMQYLIIDELHKLIKKCQKPSCNDKFVLLTHNVFFYLNCSFEIKSRRDDKNPFEECNFYRLLSNNKKTNIIKVLNRNQDFKTNYEALWHELIFLYKEDKPEMMLNPIRRIIETYVVFNGKEDFYKNHKDAKNLFNTNSHYFPDLEADLNGKNREVIIEMMKQCFKSNNAENHFNKHWKNGMTAVQI